MAGQLTQRAPLKAPLSVCLWISDDCNLACRYCYAMPFSGRMMDTARLYGILDELIALEVFGIVLAGGEPFMHPDCLDIIDYCTSRDVQVGVLTNGALLDKTAIQRLDKMVKGRRFILQISLDSVDAATNNRTRGAGAKVIENIRELCKTDIRLQLATVVTKHNAMIAQNVIGEFYPAIKRFHFLNVQRTEKSLKHPQLLLSADEARDFWLGLKAYAQGFPPDLFLPSLRIMLRAAKEEASPAMSEFHQQATFDCKTCSVGLTHINIDADFNVLGCDIAKDFSNMGNVRRQSFAEVWHSPRAHAIRNLAFPPCYRNKTPEGESLQDYLKDECNVPQQPVLWM